MQRKSRHKRWRPRSEPHAGPGAKVVVACVASAVAILAVLALPAVVRPSAARTTRSGHGPNAWDAPTNGAQAGLDSISRATHAARAARLSSDPVANVRDVSARYTTARLAEIRDELAKIDATDWKTQADLDRRQALLDEQRRLTRY